jgi:TolB protein
VWVDFSSGHYFESDIFMTDIKTGEVTHITENSTSVNMRLRISGNTVVWENWVDTSNPDVYMYDIPTQTTTRLTFGGVQHITPVVDGNIIAWQDNSRTALGDILTYKRRTGQETWLTDSTASHSNPAIYQNTVVWQDYRNGPSDIYMYSQR